MASALAPATTGVTTSQPTFIWRTREELEDIAAREPTNPVPLYLLASLLRRTGEPRWRSIIDEAMKRSHHTPQRMHARGQTRITLGDWGGWTDYEARFQNPDTVRDLSFFSEITWRSKPWDGKEDLSGQSLVVLPEQGHGDCLQMWRFVPALLQSTCGTTTLMLYPRLVSLARHNFGSRAKISLCVKPAKPFDRYVWSMSLPSIFGGLPPFEPLHGTGRRPLPAFHQRPVRAGLCWAGNPGYLHDVDRSISLDVLAPLLEHDDVEWISLQVGSRAGDASQHPVLRSLDPPLTTYLDTANIIAQLDFVVTVDTSVAHIAGLCGVPIYMLLQSDSHWRWGLEETTPWYPSMRLVRQPTFGDWASVIRQVQAMVDRCDYASEVTE